MPPYVLVGRHTRARKAIDLIGTNDEGLMWVKIFLRDNSQNGQKASQMVPIRWLKIARENATTPWTDEQFLEVDDTRKSSDHEEFEVDENNIKPDCYKPACDQGSGSGSPSASAEGVDCWIHVSRASRDHTSRSWTAGQSCEQACSDDGSGSAPATCAVCLERPVDIQLLPCGHDEFCRTCILESICCWNRSLNPPLVLALCNEPSDFLHSAIKQIRSTRPQGEERA